MSEQTEFRVPGRGDLAAAETAIERACSALGLRVGMKGTLRSYPGSVHWHLKYGKESGTLELTLLARERRLWAQVQRGRRAPWIEEALPNVKRAVERALSGRRSP